MDIRAKRSRDKIIDTFLKIRGKKRLEKITVTEICKSAQINKSTFYAHFHDVYDLSDFLETQLVEEILSSITYPENLFTDKKSYVVELAKESTKRRKMIEIVFADEKYFSLAKRLMEAYKDYYFKMHPELKDDPDTNIRLTYSVYGGFYTYYENLRFGSDKVVEVIGNIESELS